MPRTVVPQHILVIKLSALGDFVQALGPMKAIRNHHAKAQITLLTTVPFAGLGQATGWFDHVWIDSRPSLFNFPAWWSSRQSMKNAGFDRVYDLQTSSRTNFYYRALFAVKPQWSGVAPGCSHPHTNPRRDFMHTIDRQREQLDCAGISQVPESSLDWVTADLSSFDLGNRYGLLVPGGVAHRPAKRWSPASYGEIANKLNTAGIQPVIVGVPGEQSLSQKISRQCPASLDLVGRTSLTELAALARHTVLAVGNDTGPMHMAAVGGGQTIVLFSAESDPALCAPRGPRVTVLCQDNLSDLPVTKVAEALEL